jgi:hypothetical protein
MPWYVVFRAACRCYSDGSQEYPVQKTAWHSRGFGVACLPFSRRDSVSQSCQDRGTRNMCRTCASSFARLRCVASEGSPASLREASPYGASLSLIKRSILDSDFRIAFSSAGVAGSIPHSAYRLSKAVIMSSIRLGNRVASDSVRAAAQASCQECPIWPDWTQQLPQPRKKQATGEGHSLRDQSHRRSSTP